MKRKNEGITLVALVITIIVLIILAGVTISMVVGDNGIITKSKEAKQNMSNATAEEKELMQNMLNEMNEIESGNSEGQVKPPDPPKDPTDSENWDKEKVSEVITEGEKSAPIPKGYVVSKADKENTISGGLVIYEGTEEVTNENVQQAQTARNQYVWIPVDNINDMVMCKSKTADTQCNIVRQEDGSFKCEEHDSTDLAGKLYDAIQTAGSSGVPYTYTMNFSQNNQSYNPNSGYREPAIVSGDDGKVTFDQMNNDFKEMVKSVYTYGGFYISRYEIGIGGTSKKEQNVLCNNSEANDWYGLYNTIRHKATEEEVVDSINF